MDADTHFDPLLPPQEVAQSPEPPFQLPVTHRSEAGVAITLISSDSSPASLPRLRPRKTVRSCSTSSRSSSNSDDVGLLTLATAANSSSSSSDAASARVAKGSIRLKKNPGPVVQLQPRRSTSISKSKPSLISTKPDSAQVVQLDDVLLALPSNFSVDSWADAKLRLIGLMKNTGHSRAFIRTSKAPPSHAVYWAKVICPECPSFIIGSASAANFY